MVAFVLMAFASSLPELFVGITSALNKKPELSFGNVLGANIINLTLAVAVAVLIGKTIKTDAKIIRKSSVYTIIIALLPILLIFDKTISRMDGVILLVAVLFYSIWLRKEGQRFNKVYQNSNDKIGFQDFFKKTIIFLVAIVFLLLSAQGIVWSSSGLAIGFGFSLFSIGLIVLALGTALPEIIFSIKATSSHHKDMVLGGLMGSVAVNSSLILGITALIYPLKIESVSPYLAGIIFTFLSLLFFVIFTRTRREITRKEGVILLLLYFAFIIVQFLLI